MLIGKAKVEIIRLQKIGEYYDVQFAIGGVLAPSMEVHASAREQYRTEQAWLDYLTRSSETLLQMYGDARHPRSIDMGANEAPYMSSVA